MKRSRAVLGMATAAAAVLAAVPFANAGEVNQPPVAEGLAGPLGLTFDGGDRPLVTQAFGPGVVTRVKPGGKLVDVVQDDGAISGVAYRKGAIAYTLSGGLPDDVPMRAALKGAAEGPYQLLKVRTKKGKKRVVANIGRAETNRNPDAHQVYGWLDYLESCGEPAPEGNRPRGGIVESNPHAIAPAPGGGWYLSDAAGNTIWKAKGGKLKVVSVLRPQTLQITDEVAAMNELPECTIGTRYNFEPVGTDIEVGPGGMIYVSLLPGEGAPGAPFAPGMGAVARVNPVNGKMRVIARGFTGATNLARSGKFIYVTELFAGQVSRINTETGARRTVAYMSGPAAIDVHKGTVYATDINDGTLVTIDPSGPTLPPSPPPTLNARP